MREWEKHRYSTALWNTFPAICSWDWFGRQQAMHTKEQHENIEKHNISVDVFLDSSTNQNSGH